MGQETRKFLDMMRPFKKVPFKFGGTDFNGLDCIGFIYCFNKRCGINMPEELNGWNKENYYIKYKENEDEADSILLDYFNSFGKEIKPFEVIAGDSIIIKHDKTRRLFPAIYGGNNMAISSFLNKGVRVFALGNKLPIIKARRVF